MIIILKHWGVQHSMVVFIHVWSLFTYLSFIKIVIYKNTILGIQYVIQGHMHRLYGNTMYKTQTLDPQMYPWNSSAQGTTADASSGTSIENLKIKLDYNGMGSVIMKY